MKTRNSYYLLGLAVVVIAMIFVVPPTLADATNLLDMVDQLDKMDQQDFKSILDKADDCTQVRNFTCSEEQLRKAAKRANGSKDKQALNRARKNLQAEKKRVDDEIRARAEEERQIRLAEERRAEREQAQEQAAENRRQEEERQAANSSSDGGSYNPGLAIMQGIGEAFNKQNQLGKIQNDTMQELNRAAQERQAQADADRRAAAERRAQENERIRQQNQARREQEQQERLQKQARLREQEQARQQEQVRKQEQARKKAEDKAAKLAEDKAEKKTQRKRQAKAAQGDVVALNTDSGKNGDKSASSSNSGASGDDGNNSKAKGKSTAKKTFRKVPNTPPQGSAPEGLTKANGEYKCDAVNAYARQYGKDEDRLFNERMDAPYVSDAKCQARCDLLAWREVLIKTYRYHGDWSCSPDAVGIWNGVDAGGSYSDYNNGKNDDKCTCVTSSGAPMVFSPKPK